MNKKDLDHFTRLILEERKRKLEALGRHQGTLDEINDARAAEYEEEVTLSDDKEYLSKLIEHQTRGLEEIDYALQKIISGTYGICERTGKPISRERLEAIPTARLSLEAQQLEEEENAGGARRLERVERIKLPGEDGAESDDLAAAGGDD
jgi:RNA polymerase-binding protein DksA